MLFRSVEGGPSAGEELVELPRLCSLARDCFEVAVATVDDPYEVIVVWRSKYCVQSIEDSVAGNKRQNTGTRRQRQMHYLRGGQSGFRLGCRASEAASRRSRVCVGVVVVVRG